MTTTTPARALLDSAITEKAFQAQVIRLAELHGWMVYHTFDSRRSAKGFPDLVLVRYTHHPCLIFAELKTERGRVSVAQSVWIRALQVVAAKCPNLMGVFVWRPSMWSEIERALGVRKPRRTGAA